MRFLAVTCVAAGLSLAACSEDRSQEASAGAAAEPGDAVSIVQEEHGDIPEPDIVYGRQVLMTALLNLMLPIDRAAAGDSFDLGDARRRAESISAILVAFPFMFPEGAGPEETRDNDWPSIALPAVWEENEAFHEKAEEVSEIAFDLVAITDEAAFRAKARELRQGCDSCHASFMYDWRGDAYGLDPVTGEPLPSD